MNSDAVMAEARGAAERLAIVAEKPAHLIRWGEGDRLDLQSVLAALSPPSTGGEGEALIMRVGERIADEVEKVAAGRQSNCEQAARDIVGWLHPSPEMGEISREEIAKIVDPIAFKQWQSLHDHCVAAGDDAEEARATADWAHKATCDVALEKADQILKFKENGLSREELGGSARASRGAAGPSDCAEGDAPRSDGGANPSGGSGA